MRAGENNGCRRVDVELDRQFAGRGLPLSSEAQRHLEECERCETLYRSLANDFPTDAVSGEVEQQIVRRIQGSLKPVPRLRSTAAIASQIVIVFLLIALAAISRMKVIGFAVMTLPQLTGMSAVLSLGIVFVALSLAWQMRPGSSRWIPEWALLTMLVAGLVMFIALLFPWKTSDAFVLRGFRCLGAGLALSAPAALVFGYMVRRGAPLNLTSAGATVGAAAGLLGVAVLQYTCDLQNIGHLLVWHVGVVVLSTLAGALIGGSFMRYGARSR
jgi:hypothetical protein